MIVRSSRVLVLFFAAALVGLAMFSGVLIFQLSRGPISLSFLTPLVEQALSSDTSNTRVRLHDTALTWEGDTRALDIRATGLQFLDSDDRVRATIPEMTVKFSARALLRGLVAPTNLELFGPRVKIVRSEAGELSLDFGGESAPENNAGTPVGLVEELLRPPNRNLASGYLSGVSLRSAFVEFEDQVSGRKFLASNTNFLLERDADGIRAEGSITVGEGEDSIHLGLSGVYRTNSRSGDVGIVFSEIAPSAFVQFDPALAPFERLDARVDGTVTLAIDSAFQAIVGSLDLRIAAGTIDANPVYEEPLSFDSVALRLNAEQASETVTLESLEIALGQTMIVVSGDAVRDEGLWSTTAQAELRDLPINEIARYWPLIAEPNAREWVTENVRDGHVDIATAQLAAVIPEQDPGSFLLEDIGAEIRFRDATVHYLRPMEPITDGAGVARVNEREAVIDVLQGRLRNIVAEEGQVVIGGLDGPSKGETIKIEATVAGPVRDALEVLDSEPLGFISGFGIDPTRTSGLQRTSAVFAFPLLDAIKVEEIAVATSSRLVDFSAAEAAFGFPVENGNLDLEVNRDGLEARGTAEIGKIPVGLTWVERFSEGGELRTRYEVRTVLDDAAREILEFDSAPYLTGPIGLGLTYSVGWDDVSAGAAELDLIDTQMSLEPFGWTKDSGVPGRAFLRFHSSDAGLLSVPEFEVEADDLLLKGAARFRIGEETFGLQDMQFSQLRFGENDVVAAVEFPANGAPEISLGGTSIDLRPVMELVFGDDEDGESEDDDNTPAMRIVVSEQTPIGSVRLGEETSLLGAHGTLVSDGTNWSQVLLRGKLSNAGNMFVRVEPEDDLRRVLVETDDAGGLLNALDWVNTIKTGEMRVRGTFQGTGDDEVFAGQVDAQGFVLTEEPFAAKVLALASFSGIGDVLGGEGITFRRAEIPLRMTKDEIVIKDAKARGAEIGIITSGKIDRNAETLSLEGEVAPAYTLNSLLANIPLIGPVLSGGSEGIFAATFSASGPLDDPEVSVNPLSVLTPGIVRKLLSGFEGDAALDPETELPDPEAPEAPE